MLRIVRIALVALVPTLAVAAVSGCDDDTAAPTVHDMSGAAATSDMTSTDMADHD